jgi:1-deoxy-D-xylulose-5-phosphate synthase
MSQFLDIINSPDDLKKLTEEELAVLAPNSPVLIGTVAKTGGHLASNPVVWFTLALHYCFNSPFDKIIWDVGHRRILIDWPPCAFHTAAASRVMWLPETV